MKEIDFNTLICPQVCSFRVADGHPLRSRLLVHLCFVPPGSSVLSVSDPPGVDFRAIRAFLKSIPAEIISESEKMCHRTNDFIRARFQSAWCLQVSGCREPSGCRVRGAFTVQGSGCRQGAGLNPKPSGCRVQDSGNHQGLGARVEGSGVEDKGLGVKGQGWGVRGEG